MLHQGGGFPPDQLAKYRERKQLIDQIVAKDAEEMKRTIDVSILALGYNDLAFILVVQWVLDNCGITIVSFFDKLHCTLNDFMMRFSLLTGLGTVLHTHTNEARVIGSL